MNSRYTTMEGLNLRSESEKGFEVQVNSLIKNSGSIPIDDRGRFNIRGLSLTKDGSRFDYGEGQVKSGRQLPLKEKKVNKSGLEFVTNDKTEKLSVR